MVVVCDARVLILPTFLPRFYEEVILTGLLVTEVFRVDCGYLFLMK